MYFIYIYIYNVYFIYILYMDDERKILQGTRLVGPEAQRTISVEGLTQLSSEELKVREWKRR